MTRTELLGTVLACTPRTAAIVAPLGFTARDLYANTGEDRDRCFFNFGAMGSVIPFALGVSLAIPGISVLALEGDGSLLMNLGCLVTLRRYGGAAITVVILDNRCYESTGGQPSQPPSLSLAQVCHAIGLETDAAETVDDVARFMRKPAAAVPRILVARTIPSDPAPRVPITPASMAHAFASWLAATREWR